MSNYLAIATVTAALGQRVAQVINDETGLGVNAHYGRPSGNEAQTVRKVHVCLYQVTPNPARRNDDTPTRDADGKLIARPRAALDLHYLLAFYGDAKTLEAERMLGAVVSDFHERPLLSATMIQSAMNDDDLAVVLAKSDLLEAVDRVRLTPAALSLDELSKLWSVFFQTPHALSVAYTASVVLIDAIHGGARAAPVLNRGEGDRGASAQANAIPPFPLLENLYIGEPSPAALTALARSYPAAVVGNMLILRGMNLGGATVKLHFRHLRFADPQHPQHWQLDPLDPERMTDTEIRFTLDVTPDRQWRVGTYGLTVQLFKNGKAQTTNELMFQLAPRITSITPAEHVGGVGLNLPVRVNCEPAVLGAQSVELVLAEAPHAIPLTDRPPNTVSDSLQFELKQAPATNQSVVRIRVDGVESIPYAWQGDPPSLAMLPKQTLTITPRTP